MQQHPRASPPRDAGSGGPLLAATTARDRCSLRDDEHHYCCAQTAARNGNPITPDIGQSGLRLLFTCIPIAAISVVPSDDPMGAPATTASYAGEHGVPLSFRLAIRGKLVSLPSRPSQLSLLWEEIWSDKWHCSPRTCPRRQSYSVRLTVTLRSRMPHKRWLLPCVLRMGSKAFRHQADSPSRERLVTAFGD